MPTQDSHLVAEDDDLDGQIGNVAPLQAQQLKRSDKGEIEKGQSHRQPSSLERPAANFLLTSPIPSAASGNVNSVDFR